MFGRDFLQFFSGYLSELSQSEIRIVARHEGLIGGALVRPVLTFERLLRIWVDLL